MSTHCADDITGTHLQPHWCSQHPPQGWDDDHPHPQLCWWSQHLATLYWCQCVNTSKYTFFIFHFFTFYFLSLPPLCPMTITMMMAPSLALPNDKDTITPIREPICLHTPVHACLMIYKWVHLHSHANPHAHPTIHRPMHACPCTYLHSSCPHLQPFPMTTATHNSASSAAALKMSEAWPLGQNIEKTIKMVHLMQPLKVPKTWLPCTKSSCSSVQLETLRKSPRCSQRLVSHPEPPDDDDEWWAPTYDAGTSPQHYPMMTMTMGWVW